MLSILFKKNSIVKTVYSFICLIALFLYPPVLAQENAYEPQPVTLQLTNKIAAYGEFYPGGSNKPVVMILHSFMLTHNFQTVKQLAESLHESSYTVLTPSLSCEAIHTHSLLGDLKDINQWVNWLTAKTGKKITLIGHSAGSSQLIAYIHHYPEAPVNQLIFLSMPNFGDTPNSYATRKDIELAQKIPDKNELKKFALSYCKEYVTTANNFISYYNLSKDNLYQYLKQTPIKKTLILGSEDTRVDKNWNKSLASTNTTIIIIEGANHFFDAKYEFDLLDTVESVLTDHP